MNNNNSLKYPLPSSICDGALLMDSNVKVPHFNLILIY